MPRPRFDKLEPDKRRRILDVAAEEFAESGFEGASYNRIIERAGLSKGAMYYYFDDKTDLYGTVLQAALSQVMGQVALPASAGEPEAFWAGLEQQYHAVWAVALQRPQLVTLVRGLFEHPERARVGPIAQMYDHLRAFTEQLIVRGRELGAVRRDVETDLLVAAAFALGEALDRWSLERIDGLEEAERAALAAQLVGLLRSLLEPRGEAR